MRNLVFFLFLCSSLVWANNWSIALQHAKSNNESYEAEQQCNFFWKVLDSQNAPVSNIQLKKHYKNFMITISIKSQSDDLVGIYKIPLEIYSYKWDIPAVESATTYAVHLDAVPKELSTPRLSGVTTVQVQQKSKQDVLPQDLGSCIRVLMDWNGKRGYYKSCSPTQALKVVQYACKFIRDNADSSEYQDYLQVMEKAESIQLKKLRVYCPVRRSRLHIDKWYMGALNDFDSKRQKFYLDVDLPVDYERAYKIELERGNRNRELFHTHTGESECVVDGLYELLSLTVKSSVGSQVKSGNSAYSSWGNFHKVEMYASKVQTLWIKIENGPTLKIFLNPKKSIVLQVKKQDSSFVLYKNNVKYNFVGNVVNLTEF